MHNVEKWTVTYVFENVFLTVYSTANKRNVCRKYEIIVIKFLSDHLEANEKSMKHQKKQPTNLYI